MGQHSASWLSRSYPESWVEASTHEVEDVASGAPSPGSEESGGPPAAKGATETKVAMPGEFVGGGALQDSK